VTYYPDEERTRKRLSELRADRNSPVRQAQIAALTAKETAKARAKASGNGRKTPQNSTTYFGHSWDLWHRMRDAGIAHIEECARRRTKTTYAETWSSVGARVGEDIGHPYRQIGHLMGHIAVQAHETTNDAILTALVVHEAGDDNPGPGFFRLAGSWGLLAAEDTPDKGGNGTEMTPGQRAFWEEQIDAVYRRYATETVAQHDPH
jgi:hypothetical protein